METTVVLYAPPMMGHIVSMTELAKLILRRRPNGLSIIILYGTDPTEPPTTSAILSNLITSNPSITFLHLPPPPLPPPSSRKISRLAVMFESIRLNAPDVLSALRQISSTDKQITGFIIDMFCSTALPLVSEQLGIPTYYFFTSGLAALSPMLYMPTIEKRVSQLISLKDSHDLTLEFPGLPPIPAIKMPEALLDRHDPAYGEIMYSCSCIAKSKGILVNTFDELEPVVMAAIFEGLCLPDSPTPPVYNIGPLIVSEGNSRHHECLSWLDSQPTQSVVFLCFGSRGVFSIPQLKEIATGLEKTGKRFLWVVKNPPTTEQHYNLETLLPKGFMERTKDIGMVVSNWAPQVTILRNKLVGGFVTHCGWNSVLEAVMAGQPMVAWPLYAEQHLNMAVLVKDMGMAIGVQEGEDGFVSGDELARCVEELMDLEKGKVVREKSAVMKEKVVDALKEGGSSMVALEKVLKLWCEN